MVGIDYDPVSGAAAKIMQTLQAPVKETGSRAADLLTLKGWPADCSDSRMANSVLAKWYVSENVCALCDAERHLAHVVRLRSQWFVIDATHFSAEKLGCLFIGSFARRQTAMQAAEAEVLGHVAPIAMRGDAPDMSRVRGLAAALLRQSNRPAQQSSSAA